MSESQQLPQNVPPHLVGEFHAWVAAQGPQTQSGIRTIPISNSLSPVFALFANIQVLVSELGAGATPPVSTQRSAEMSNPQHK